MLGAFPHQGRLKTSVGNGGGHSWTSEPLNWTPLRRVPSSHWKETTRVRVLRFIVLALGAIGVLGSLPLLGLAVLGHLGALADAGPVENRELGNHLLFLGLPTLICGAVFRVLRARALPEPTEMRTR
jgi:hypothetical protein